MTIHRHNSVSVPAFLDAEARMHFRVGQFVRAHGLRHGIYEVVRVLPIFADGAPIYVILDSRGVEIVAQQNQIKTA
jgi:hypothetical protein